MRAEVVQRLREGTGTVGVVGAVEEDLALLPVPGTRAVTSSSRPGQRAAA